LSGGKGRQKSLNRLNSVKGRIEFDVKEVKALAEQNKFFLMKYSNFIGKQN
jgi:hypothetical protein